MSARFHPTVRPALAALSGLLLSTAAGSQPPPPSPAPGLGFPARVDLVMVDVVVLDERGNPVEGLQAGDFVVREDGHPQALASFEAVGLPESAPTLGPESLFVSTNRTGAARVPPRSFGIVFDDAQLSQPTGERARAALAKFIREQLRDDDEVILVSTATGAWWSARAGEGRSDLLAVLERLEGRRRGDTGSSFISDYEAMRLYLNRDQQVGAQVVRRFHENGMILDPGTQAAAQSRQELDLGEGHPLVRVKAAEAYSNAKQRNLATLRALTRLGDALAPGKGRKSVLLVSDGFVHDTTLPEFRSVVAAMSRANAAIYYLDARGLPGTGEHAAAEVGRATLEQDVLTVLGQGRLETEGAESVAIDTGGYSFRNPNDLLRGMEKIAQESRSYYLIGYSSPNTRKDGKLRKIQVEVRRPGVQVRARKGYYPGAAAEPVSGSRLDPQVRQALDSPFAIGGIGLRMAAYVLGGGAADKTAVLVAVEADPADVAFEHVRDRFDAELDSYLVVTERDSGQTSPLEKKVDLSLPADLRARIDRTWLPMFREIELAPGAYQARFLVRDRRSGRMGTVRHEFEVPVPGQLRTSTPILTDSMQHDAAGPRPVPLARRVFAAGSNLVYLFEVYGARRDPAVGSPRVVSRYEVRRAGGSILARTDSTPIPPGPQGQLSRQTAVPLRGVPAGDYEIVLTVEDQVAGRTVEVRDAFTVAAPPSSPASGRP